MITDQMLGTRFGSAKEKQDLVERLVELARSCAVGQREEVVFEALALYRKSLVGVGFSEDDVAPLDRFAASLPSRCLT